MGSQAVLSSVDIPLEAVLDTVPDGVIAIDSDGHILSFSKAAASIFGYSPEEVAGQNIKTLMPEPYHSEHDGYIRNYVTTGRKKIIGTGREVTGKRKDGSLFPMELGVNETRINGNRLFVGLVRDITAQKNADAQIKKYVAALAEGEERYRLVIDGLSVGIWDWRIPSNELFWSVRFREILRTDQNLADVYNVWEERLHPDDKQSTIEALQNHLTHRTIYDVEYRLRRDDGSYVWIHAKGKAVWDANGRAQRMVGSIEDISWRKQAENAFKAEAIRLTTVMNTVLDGLITIDSKGIIQSFNSSATRVFGYRPEEVVGQNVKMLMPEPYRIEHDGYIKNYLDTGERKVIGIGREVVGRRKDGSTFPMELGINEMHMGQERMFVGTVRDITERKEAEAAIHQYVEKLKRSNQELDDFAYIASHDLKEPIRGLTNNALFLCEDYEDKLEEAGKKRLNRMAYLCKRMEQLVDDLLYFSRLGRQELAVQQIDLNQIIYDIKLMMEITLQEKNAEIVIPTPLPVITCDVPRVTEIFRNLVTNAVKYNKSDKKIVEIGVAPESTAAQRIFYVKDNGIGIEEKFFSDIFRIFKRLNEEDEGTKGTGVGLTFVKKIIERHGGKIWLTSTPGQGTTFYFTLSAQEGT